MEYKRLGRTDLLVSRIAFGCYPMGGWDWGKVSDRDSVLAVRKAIQKGINLFDTADIYGLGHSEEVLTKGLGAYRKKAVIATKVGLKWDPVKKSSQRDLSPAYLKRSIEKSLSRLKISCIPIYQIHYLDNKTPIGETVDMLKKLQKQGKFKYLGISNCSVKSVLEFQKYARIESIQLPYNLLNQETARPFYSVCREHEISIFSYGSLAQGLLSGKYDARMVFKDNDHRSRDKNFKATRFAANLEIVGCLKKMSVKYARRCSQLSLNWILSNPDISSAIVGMKTARQVDENTSVAGWRILRQDYEKLMKIRDSVYKKYNLF